MNHQSRIFDFLTYQLNNYPKADMFGAKENGQWVKYSTQQVKDTVDCLSIALLQAGISGNDMKVANQDKVALISKNRPEWLMLDMACQQIGALLCPIYPTTNVNELAFIFNDASIKIAFVSGEDIFAKVDSIKSNVPSLKNIYSFDELEGPIYWKNILQEPTTQQKENLQQISSNILADHCATIIYTSGTTGFPKGVMLSHKNIVTNVLNAINTFPFHVNPASKSLSFLPLNHIFERMASYIYISSATSIYYAENLETIGENLKEVQPNLFCTVPRLLEKVYEKIMAKGSELTGVKRKLFDWAVALGNEYDVLKDKGVWYNIQLAIANKLIFSKWREALGNNVNFIITGGAACQVRLIRIFSAAKIPIYEGYRKQPSN
jgi:long-chain acyl-CoA synthetase